MINNTFTMKSLILAQVAISYPAMKFWIMPGQARPKKNKKKRRKK